jgi:hypothetical protein
MSEFENATPTSDKLRSFIENLQQPNARLRVSTPNNLGSEDDHYTSSDVFPLIVRAVNAFEPLIEALEMVRDADENCKRDGLTTMPPMARAKIDAALAKARGEQ